MTEIHHFLRAAQRQARHAVLSRLQRRRRAAEHRPDRGPPAARAQGEHIGLLAPLVTARKGYYTDLAKWAGARGTRTCASTVSSFPWRRGRALDRYKEHTIELPVADVVVDPANEASCAPRSRRAGERPGRDVRGLAGEQAARGAGQRPAATALLGQARLPVLRHQLPRTRSAPVLVQLKHGWCTGCFGTGLQLQGFDEEQTGEETAWNAWYEGEAKVCTQCDGQRLNRVARAVRWRDKSIAELASLPVSDAHTFFTGLVARGREGEIARDILTEIRGRLNFMQEVGLNYLALDRAAPTLSGGEAQRIRLAAQLGSNLQGVCYVLDEPTIGHCTRATTASCWTRWRGWKATATRWWWSSMTTTPSAAPRTSSTSAPAPACAAGRVRGPGQRQDLIDAPESVTGRYLAHPLKHAAGPPPGRGRHAHDPDPRRAPAQPAPCRRADPGGPAERGDGRVRLGQVHAGARSAAGQPDAGRLARQAARLGRLRQHRRLGGHRPRAGSGPDAHRQDAALLPRHLRGLLGRRAQAVRRHARGPHARLDLGALLFQHRRRPLPDLRGPGHAHHRNELPAGREGALRRLQRRALQPGHAERADARQERRRAAVHGSGRRHRLLRRPSQDPPTAAADAGRGPGLPDAGPALAHAVRRRGAASSW